MKILKATTNDPDALGKLLKEQNIRDSDVINVQAVMFPGKSDLGRPTVNYIFYVFIREPEAPIKDIIREEIIDG